MPKNTQLVNEEVGLNPDLSGFGYLGRLLLLFREKEHGKGLSLNSFIGFADRAPCMKDVGNWKGKLWWDLEIRKSPEHQYPSQGVLMIEGTEQPEAAGVREHVVTARCVLT